MKLTALSLFLLILVPSCTLEKRLHSRGWNVHWRKHHKVTKDQIRENGVSQNAEIKINQLIDQASEQTFTLTEPNREIVEEGLDAEESIISGFDSVHSSDFYVESEDTTKESALTPSPNADMSTSHERNPRTSSGLTRSIVFLVLGLLFTALTLSIYFSLGSSVGLSTALRISIFNRSSYLKCGICRNYFNNLKYI